MAGIRVLDEDTYDGKVVRIGNLKGIPSNGRVRKG